MASCIDAALFFPRYNRRRLSIISDIGSRFSLNALNATHHICRHIIGSYYASLVLMPDKCLELKKKGKRYERLSFLYFSAKKLAKQIERLQVQLSEEKTRNRELSAQLTEAADYKACNFINPSFLT